MNLFDNIIMLGVTETSWCCYWSPTWHPRDQNLADCPSKQFQTEQITWENLWDLPWYFVSGSLYICLPGGVNEVDDEGGDGEDEHQADQDAPSAGLTRDQLPRPVLGLGHEVTLKNVHAWVEKTKN